MSTASPNDVHLAWKTDREIALIDLREESVHALGHPLFATCVPLSRLEVGIFDLIPRRDTPVVLFDDDGSLVGTAREMLTGWGYADVRVLDGGLEGWKAAGLELFEDVNSPSKAFGELVEHYKGTPYVAATDLQKMIDENRDMVIMDARPFEEYHTMSIPTSFNVPGAELVLRGPDLVPDEQTPVVVNCAGRTRSIIGAQSLINAGIPNPVMALRNGTIGWTLEDQDLETAQTRLPPDGDGASARIARDRARSVSYRAGVRTISFADLETLEKEPRTTYRFDVRTEEEFLAGHPRGFRFKAGGQLVQETDMAAAVRGARIVVFDDLGTRAHMTASWLAQMDWDCLVVEDAPSSAMEQGPVAPCGPPPPSCETITPQALARLDRDDLLILDLSPSNRHRKKHVPGARFVMRGRFGRDLEGQLDGKRIVLVSPDDVLARHAAAWFAGKGVRVEVLEGGTQGWVAAGLPTEAGFEGNLSEPDDIYRRPYEGLDNPREKMQAYLDWEYGLVAQLERDGSHGFHVI